MEFIIVSGMSGGGKSQAASGLEDMGYYCVDNMPVAIMPIFAEFCLGTPGRYDRVALVTDVRSKDNFDELFKALDKMESLGCPCRILFMEAETPVIIKRYKETRRRHPLDPTGKNLSGAIAKEREMLRQIRERADVIIDTSVLTIGQLNHKLSECFTAPESDRRFSVTVLSFGFKHGLPLDADIVLDARFLPNPYYIPELRELTGLDREVNEYLDGFPQTERFAELTRESLSFLLPNYVEEGKPSLTIAIGCTGGHHRSVAMASRIAEMVESLGYPVSCFHRDIDK